MRRFILKRVFFFIIAILLSASPVSAYEIVAVLSSQAKPYALALQAFHQHLKEISPKRGLKSIQDNGMQIITLQPKESATLTHQRIQASEPDLIIAFGSKALHHTALARPNTPIIYLLVPSPQKSLQSHKEATGVLLQPKPGVEFKALQEIFPAGRRIGVVYDPNKSAALVAATIANNKELTFTLRPIRHAQEVASQLATLKNKVDLIWMLPDPTTLSPQAEKSFYIFSLRQKIPLLAFSDKYLQKGASFAVTLDIVKMGQRAADLAFQVKNGSKPSRIRPVQFDEVEVKRNNLIINKLGLTLQETSE